MRSRVIWNPLDPTRLKYGYRAQHKAQSTGQTRVADGTVTQRHLPRVLPLGVDVSVTPLNVQCSQIQRGVVDSSVLRTVRLTTNLTGGPRVACPTGYKRGSPLVQYPISLTQVRGRSALTTAFSNVARSSSRQTGGTRLSLDRGLQALEEIYRVIFGEIARAVGLGRRCVAGGSATCVVDLSLS